MSKASRNAWHARQGAAAARAASQPEQPRLAFYPAAQAHAVIPVTPAEQAAANGGLTAPGGFEKLKVRGPGIGVDGIRAQLNKNRHEQD